MIPATVLCLELVASDLVARHQFPSAFAGPLVAFHIFTQFTIDK